MKKKLIFTGIVAGVLVFVLALIPVLKSGQAAASDVYGYNATTKTIDLPTKKDKSASDYESTLGNEDNPYVIMELVPYEDMAMMGYLVQGQGAVKESALADQYVTSSNDAAYIYKRLFESTTNTTNDNMQVGTKFGGSDTVATSQNVTKKIFTDDASSSDLTNNDTVKTNTPTEPEYAQYGYFIKVEKGKGKYKLEQITKGNSTVSYKFVKTTNNDGEYNWVALGELSKSETNTDKNTSQFVFTLDYTKMGLTKDPDGDGYYYLSADRETKIFVDSLGTYKVPVIGVHEYISGEGNGKIYDRLGNVVTKNNHTYTSEYGSYTLNYDDKNGWPYYYYSNNLKFRLKKGASGPVKYYVAGEKEHELTEEASGTFSYKSTKGNEEFIIYITAAGTFQDSSGNKIVVNDNGDFSKYASDSEESGASGSSGSKTSGANTSGSDTSFNSTTKTVKAGIAAGKDESALLVASADTTATTSSPTSISWYTSDDIGIGRDAFKHYTEEYSDKDVYDFSWYDTSTPGTAYPDCSDETILSGMQAGTITATSDNNKYYTFRFDEKYCESYQFVITNNDTLSKKILGRGAYSETNPSGAHIEVIPVTPAILDTVKDDSAKRLIDMADMIVIHDMLDARLMKDSNDYNDDIAPVDVTVNKNEGDNTTSGSIKKGDKGYHYFLWKNGYSVNTSGANGSGAIYTKFYGDDAAGLLESAVRNGLVSDDEYNKMTISGKNANGEWEVKLAKDVYPNKSKFEATRGYFTSSNDISKTVMNEIVKRQASGHPAAMVLDSSAIYKESSTQLKTSSDDKETTTTTTTSNYHDGVPSALTVSFENSPFSSQISCKDYANHSDPNKNTYIHPADTSAAYFHNGNEVWLSYNGGKISFTNNTDTDLSLYSCTITVPSYIFFDYPTHKGNQGQCVKEIKNHISGDVNNLEIDFYSLKDNHDGDPNRSGIKGFVTLGAHKTLGPFELRLECLDTPEYQQMASAVDLNKCPIKFKVIDGSENVWDSSKYNQDVAEHLNELYIINNYYGAKYFYNVYGVKRDSNGKVVDENTDYIPDYTDPSITGYADDTDAEHSYPKVQTYKYNYTYDQWGNITKTEREEINIDEIRDALVPLTMSHRSYNYLTDAAPANYTPSNDDYSLPTNTHLTQGSYGNGIGKSEFVWDFDGNRSAFSTCFNMSNYSTGTVSNPQTRLGGATAAETANTASNIVKSVSTGLTPAAAITSNAVAPSGAVNTSGAVTTQDYSDKGITRPQYMDSDVALNDDGTQAKDANGNTIPTVDETNLDEVFDQRFAKDANGNVLAINDTNDTSGNVVNADGTVVTKNDTNTALLQTSITRADMLAFINKEALGYNGTTGDKYKTSLKILEVEPTDEFVYGSYYKTEKNDAASNATSKYFNHMNNNMGINISTNVDWYSNFTAIKNGFVYNAEKRSSITYQGHTRYYYSGVNNWRNLNQVSKGSASSAKEYIKYENRDWKDWKEYFYSMIPGFIGSGTTSNGVSEQDYMTDVTIETMPVWKFNAKNEDINSEYDIIVVGATQNYKNGQLKRIYSKGRYGDDNNFSVDTHMNGADNNNNRMFFRRWICYNDPNLESYDMNSLGPSDNVGTPPSHDSLGDPSYALAWTAVGDYVDTSSGNSSMNEGWYANNTKNANIPYAYSGNVVINTVSSAWINTRFTKQPIGNTTTIQSNGGSDASQAGTRYEARDFTKKKAEALLDFADKNLLVIDDAAYSNGAVDGYIIDSRSEMYYVAKTLYGNQKNISMSSSLKDNKSLFNVRKNTLLTQCDFSTDGIADAKWPVEYSYTDNPINATSNSQKVNGDDGLVFTVSVDGKKYNDDGTLKTYHINVYTDVNNNSVYDGSLSEQRKTLSFAYNDENKNGIYDSGETQPVPINAGTSEKLTAVSIYDITDSSNKIEISSTQHYPYDAIYAGRKYSVEAALSDNYFGAIGYKFEISEGHIDDISEGMSADDRNASLRSEKTGLTRFRQAGKKIIHILQINPVADMRNNAPNNTMAFYNMPSFKEQMANVPDFYVEIDFLHNNINGNGFYDYDKGRWVEGSFTTGDVTLTSSNNNGTNGCVAETWPLVQSKDGDFKFTLHDLTDFSLFLENYDMVFLAGRDSAMVSNDPVFIKGLDKYSAQGGSIIMSHDMVSSFFNIHSISSADYRFSAWNRQMMLQIYYLQKLQGQVEKYYTPGTTNYSYNTMYASSNTSRNREKSVMMPLEATFALALNQSNAYSGTVLNDAAIANDVRFADQYDFTNSSEYLDKVVDDTLATGNRSYSQPQPDPYSGKYNDSTDNNRAIMTRDAYNGYDLRFDKKYPAGWQSTDSSKYADGSWHGQTEGEYAKYFASLVTNNDLYNLEHYVTSNVNQNLIEDVNSFGLLGQNGSTDLAIKNWGWVPTTDRIQNVNKGKVSSYPFDMSKDESNGLVTVTATHMQQYRLDLDHTNDPKPLVDGKMSNITDDTIVWYNLANTDDNYLYNFQKGDSANNYYIYTKGNITYTGVGHLSVSLPSEIRLFINTMIASYRPAEGTPYIKVTNSDIRTSGDTTTVYFDESTGNTGIITFQVMDPTLANIKRDYYLKVYEVDPDGTERLTTDGTITKIPSAEHVLSLYSGNTLTNAVDGENEDTKRRHVSELQNAPTIDKDGTSINKLVSGEYGFSYKVQKEKGGRYCFQGDVGKKYCIHLCYRNYKTNSAKNKVDYGPFKEVRHYVKLQKLEYFDLY